MASPPVSSALPRGPSGIAYGGDYNPEQWSEAVWEEDVRLMREAGVSLVTVGVFSWARLEPARGVRDFAWLDRVLDLLHGAGIRVDLATATASPPGWLVHRHPEILPVDARGVRLAHGSRQAWCPSSPVFRAHALSLVEHVAVRYADHPALAMWHVSNELGCHNVHCYCDVSAEAFRRWLRHRYGDLPALNAAWGTDFWSQRYGEWDEIAPPRATTAVPNPTQQLDFARFSSDELLSYFVAERDVLHRVTPDVPVTTNFMVSAHISGMDYFAWSPEVDVVSNDHYLDGRLVGGPIEPHQELSLCADWTRGVARGAPWLLMEHSPSAVNWQPRNYAKTPGQMRRNSLQHVARGADFVGFFQWRASAAGAEKFHSGMLPHAGTDSARWAEVVQLGATLRALGEVAGTRVEQSPVALVLDYECWWAAELDSHPTADLRYLDRAHAFYAALWAAGVNVDVVHPSYPLDGYRVALVPTLYLVSDEHAAALSDWVEAGGHAVVTYFSGIVDPDDHVRLGGYPGAFHELLGVRSDEFVPLRPDQSLRLDDGGSADLWAESLELRGASAVTAYADGPLPGTPAVTRRAAGEGQAWYVATRTDTATTERLLRHVLAAAGVPVSGLPAGVELVRRVGDGQSYAFVLNHTDDDVAVPLRGHELVTDRPCDGRLDVAAGGVACVREQVG